MDDHGYGMIGAVNAYGLFLGAGASLGLLRVAQVSTGLAANRQVNWGLLVLLGCLLGARVIYVLERWSYYGMHPGEIVQFHSGGLSTAGALAGGLAALVLLSLFQRNSLFQLGDDLFPLVPPLVVGTWLGCWLAGCAYGPLAPPEAWWGLPAIDESGLTAARLPLQPLAATLLLACFWLLESRLERARPRRGQLFGLGCVVLGFNLAIFLLLRSDPARLWGGLSLDVWAALGLGFIGLVSTLWVFRPAPEQPPAWHSAK